VALDLPNREDGLLERVVNELHRFLGPETCGAHFILQVRLHGEQVDKLPLRGTGRRRKAVGEEPDPPVPIGRRPMRPLPSLNGCSVSNW